MGREVRRVRGEEKDLTNLIQDYKITIYETSTIDNQQQQNSKLIRKEKNIVDLTVAVAVDLTQIESQVNCTYVELSQLFATCANSRAELQARLSTHHNASSGFTNLR